MQFEVPQFIEIEDKIFGPLTWRQFLYLGGGGGITVVLFLSLPFILFLFLGLPIALISAALAFFPINNRPFSYFLEALVEYATNQKLYLWRKKEETIHKEDPHSMFIPAVHNDVMMDRRPARDINALARKLELETMQKNS
jgi:hypothetical protein